MKTEKSKASQCPYCIEVRKGLTRLARHINTAHKDKVENWIEGI